MSFRESLACDLQKCVGNLWKRGDYSDFNVIVDDTSFKCHRFILSACSGFFQGMFKSPMKEQIEGRATLEGMTASTFEIIINAVYTGVEGLSVDNVLDVWSASEMLQIGYLTKRCHTFVFKNISVDTCFRFLNHATLYAAQTVVDHYLDFISRNFEKFRNEDRLLHLPVDQFYKVVADDYLPTDREDLVVAAILNWVKYGTQSTPITSLDSGSDTEDFSNTNDEQSVGDTSTNSLSNSGRQEKIHDGQATVSSDLTTEPTNTRSQIMETREIVNTNSVVPAQCKNVSKDATDETNIENRKQHLAKLLSACRLFTVKSNFLDNVMKNHAQLFVETGVYQLMHEALMYTMDVSRRHDAWPDPAVYRASSEFKHVMVFLSNDELMAYILNTDCVVELAKLPDYCESSNSTISIFDNIVYLLSDNAFGDCPKHLYTLEENETWYKLNSINAYRPVVLLPHGDSIYNCCVGDEYYYRVCGIYRLCCARGHVLEWSKCGELTLSINCLVRFHKYILAFCTNNNVITVECYNTETETTYQCTTSMSGASEDMVSFTHSEDVYILQRNGRLWKVFGTDETPVDFELVSKLWDFDCSLNGCVLYRKTLFVFCNNKPRKPTLTSLAGIFARIRIIQINSTTPCLPMVLS